MIKTILAAIFLFLTLGATTTFAAPPTPTNTTPGTTSSPGPVQSSNSVILRWNSSSGATTYGVGVRDMGTNQLVVDTNTSSTSFTANLLAGHQYRWNVNACNSTGCSGFTTPLYFQTPSSDSTPPTISSFTITPNTIALSESFTISYTISDSGGSGLSRAELYRAPDSGGAPGSWSGLRANSHSGNGPVSSSFSDSPSTAGTYWYGLHAIDNAGNVRNESAPIRVTVLGNLPAPTLTSPSNNATGVNRPVTFSWSSVSGATSGYRILIATSLAALPTDPTASTCSGCLINATPTSASFTTSALAASTTYFWEVHGRSGTQFGNWSTRNSFTTGSSDSTPPTINSFTVTPNSIALGESFTISYSISDSGGSGLSRAELYRAPDNGGSPGSWAGLRANNHSGNGPVTSSFTDVPSSAGIYWYGLHAIDNAGNVRNEPAPIRVTVLGNLAAPTLSAPANNAVDVNQPVNFSWSAVSGANSGYRILVATSLAALPTDPTSSSCNCVINATTSSTSYSASGLAAGTTYFWEVHARSSTQYGNWSARQTFKTKAGSDGIRPSIVSLSVNPPSAAPGGAFTISYTISDSGGSGLNRTELYRASDNGGVPGTWSGIKVNSHTGNGPTNGSFSDAPSIGTYWYGLHVIDNAGNVRNEAHPLGPVRITGPASCGSADSLRSRINNRLQFLANNPAIEYLPGSSWQAALASFNLQAYDEAYYSSLDLRGLANSAFSRAIRFVNANDLGSACTYLQRGERYIGLMVDTEAVSVLVFNERISGISEIARTIASESCKADAALLSLRLGPKASLAAESMCLPLDYVLDRSMFGKEQALQNLKLKIRTEVLAKVLIRTIPLPSLGNKTIYQYLQSGISHQVGSSRMYTLLGQAINSPTAKQEIMRALSQLGETAIIEYGVERLSCEYISWFQDSIGIPTSNAECSQFNQTIDVAQPSAPEIIETSPSKNGAYISTTLNTITARFDQTIVKGPRTPTVANVDGSTIAITNTSVQNDTVTFTLLSSLQLESVYTVTLPADFVRSVSGIATQEYSWRFSTPPSPLIVGRTAFVSNTGGVGLNLRSSASFLPDGSNVVATLPEGHRVQLIGGPVQADGFTWWNVRDNNLEGWCPVGNWLVPNDSAGMRLGAEVTVTNVGAGLDIRDAPSSAASSLGKVTNGNKLTLVSGPYYVDGYLWWSVVSAIGNGYVPVAYWLFPTSDGIAPVILTEPNSNRALAVDSVTRTRGPFKVVSSFNFSQDSHTRLMLFTSNLGITESDLDLVQVAAEGINLRVEYVGTFPTLTVPSTSYIVVRLPDELPSGDLRLVVTVRGASSVGSPTITISP